MDRRASSLVVVGASAGGVEGLRTIAGGLPADLPAAVGIVLHVSPNAPSLLPEILGRAGPLRAAHAKDGEPILTGHGDRVVAVVLSGARGDGAVGAAVVAGAGGCVVVQDPAEAPFPDMPSRTIAHDHPHRVPPLAEIASAVIDLVARLSPEARVSQNDPQG